MDILPHLLLPLAGPEEFPEDDMEKLPPDLQYLGDDKQREADPDIRKMLLEALLQVGKSLGGGGGTLEVYNVLLGPCNPWPIPDLVWLKFAPLN